MVIGIGTFKKSKNTQRSNVGLIVEDTIKYGVAPRDGVTPFYLSVPKHRLSIPYQIPIHPPSFVKSVIVDVKVGRTLSEDEQKAINYVMGKDVEFCILVVLLGSYDYLYFTVPSWAILRDAGLVTPDYLISVKLVKLKTGDTEVEIYPLRDVS